MAHVLNDMIHPDVERYAEEHTSPESDCLAWLNRWTHVKMVRPRMLSGHYQGKLLEFVSSMIRPQKILEIGSYVGYSTICLAKGLQNDGKLYSLEADEELEDIILNSVEKAGLSGKTDLRIGRALDILPQLSDEKFDLAFIDADKINYLNYYEAVVPMMARNGIILIDNILWSGKVLFEQPTGDKETAILKALNDRIQSDPRVENILLPIRDGLMMCRVL